MPRRNTEFIEEFVEVLIRVVIKNGEPAGKFSNGN
jgi:hypothetical protein